MRHFLLVTAIALPFPALAQDTVEADKGFIVDLLTENLSGAGREVLIYGFQGALSSRATIDRITIADEEGIWLDASGLVLDWDRSALLGGKIDVTELAADAITIARIPQTEPDPMAPEATAFALPDLPVSLNVDRMDIGTLSLGEPILGEAVTLGINGAASLAGGEGTAQLRATRSDGKTGSFVIDASYANATRVLGLNLALQEGADGIAARIIDLPGRPSVALTIDGTGPLEDYTANMRLATEGQDRLAGTFTLETITPEVPEGQIALPERRFDLDVGGDVTALFLTEYRDFFGPEVRLRTAGRRDGNGAMELSALDIRTDTLDLSGSANLSADGWPETIALAGSLADDGAKILLPVAGDPTYVTGATLDIAFDRATGDRWTADIKATDYERPGLIIPQLALTGGGTITAGDGEATGAATGDLTYAASGIILDDAGLAEALGDTIGGRLLIDYTEDQPVRIEQLSLSGPGLEAELTADIDSSGEELAIDLDLALEAQQIGRFATLVGQPIDGAADLDISGAIRPLSGAVDLQLDGTTTDLETGVAQLDPLLTGDGQFSAHVTRDESGARVQNLLIATSHVDLAGDVALSTEALSANARLAVPDLSLALPGLPGAGELTLIANRTNGGATTVNGTLTRGADTIALDADISAEGLATVALDSDIANLSDYAALAGTPLRGALDASVNGTAMIDASTFDLTLAANARSIGIGNESVDKLLAGNGTLNGQVVRGEGGGLSVNGLSLQFPNLQLHGDLSGKDNSGTADFDARIADIGLFTPDFSGPLTLNGTASRNADGRWSVNTDAQGPGGTVARVSGDIGANGGLALDATGNLPLAFLNGVIEPRRLEGRAAFDLSINGDAAIENINGTIRTEGAQLAAPSLGQSLEGITGTVTLAGGNARIDLSAAPDAGGNLALRGSVGLSGAMDSALTVDLSQVVLRDPQLYETTATGTVSVSGPLSGGARIAGLINLGETNVRVPSSTLGTLGDLPEVKHLNAPAAVTRTLGLIDTAEGNDGEASGGSSVAFPLDITINAPSRIFVRGRGLDAELGGSLQIGGTTAQVIPVGQFSLVRGRLDILQQRFELTEGSASLQGGFVPYIRLIAETEARSGTAVTITVEGSAEDPQVTFSSIPDLPQDEVLAQLIFGRDLSSISPIQAVQLAAAVSTLAGRGGGGMVDRFRRGAGLDDLDVTTDDSGNAAVRAGKYLSENIYTDVTVSSDGSTSIDLNLDVTDDITAKGTLNADGETSLGVFFERDY